eukprot:16450670-Heterocapsa_arctica.AAC.1
MRHNMTIREEEDILHWLEENPEFKEHASIRYDKKLLEEGRPIGGNNVTLGSRIFDKSHRRSPGAQRGQGLHQHPDLRQAQ